MSDRLETTGGRAAPMREAAVLLPLLEGDEPPLALVFIHRSKHGRHGGQIAFPGGRIEPDDATPVAAALREFEEELGVDRREVEVLETLPAMETLTSGYRVFPVLGRLRHLPVWSPDPREVAEVLVIPVSELIRPENRGETVMSFASWPAPRPVPFIQAGGHRIWGLTYRILAVVLPGLARRSAARRP